MQRSSISVTHQPCVEVSSNTVMRQCVSTIGCNIDFDDPVAFEMIIFRCGHTHLGRLRQNDNAGMIGAYTDFILSANHAEAFDTTKFCLFYRKFIIAVIKHAAKVGNNNLWSGSYIWSSADNL